MRAKKGEALPGTSLKNLIGQKFGKLTVVDFTGRDKSDYALWRCVCECGGERVVRSQELRRGETKSCGCIRREIFRKLTTKHGLCKEDWYGCWNSMVDRTSNPNSAHYHLYGGAGIKIEDPRWFDPRNFREDMGPRPSKLHSIDRIDVLKGYYKENCRWADKKTQQNNRRCNVFLEYQGVRLTQSQWEERFGLGRGVISFRIKAGWSVEDAILTPTKKRACPIEEQALECGAGI